MDQKFEQIGAQGIPAIVRQQASGPDTFGAIVDFCLAHAQGFRNGREDCCRPLERDELEQKQDILRLEKLRVQVHWRGLMTGCWFAVRKLRTLAIFGNGWSDVKCLKNAFGTGVMPQDMTKSVLVSFEGEMQPGITLCDLGNAILRYAIQAGLLTGVTAPEFVKVAATVELQISILAKISGRP